MGPSPGLTIGQDGRLFDIATGSALNRPMSGAPFGSPASAFGGTDQLIQTLGIGVTPLYGAYDGENGQIYVAGDQVAGRNSSQPNGSVGVISGSTGQLVSDIQVGSTPTSLCISTGSGDIFVPNYLANTVSILSGASNAVLATLAVGRAPFMVACDPSNGDVYVTNSASNNVTVISAASGSRIASIPVGGMPTWIVYDQLDRELYVSNSISGTVSAINDTTNLVVGTIRVGFGPFQSAVDTENGNVFVSNGGGANVSVIAVPINSVVAEVSVGSSPQLPAYDPATDAIYVPSFTADSVSVISGSNYTKLATISVGSGPLSACFDPENGQIYVPNSGSYNVSVLSGATNSAVTAVPVGADPRYAVLEPSTGDLYVLNTGAYTTSVIAGGFSITVREVGLPAGTSWTSIVAGVPSTTNRTQIVYTELPGTYSYQVSPVAGFTVTAGSGLIYLGSAYIIGITFSVVDYSVEFSENGLGAGTTWSILIDGRAYFASGSTLTIGLANGSYPYAFSDERGYRVVGQNGTLTVAGAAPSVSVGYVPLPVDHLVTFRETGLVPLTNWSVIFDGVSEATTGTSVSFTAPDGTDTWQVPSVSGYQVSTASGTATVSSDYLVAIAFSSTAIPVWDVRIDETGLPPGTNWTVIFAGAQRSAAGPELDFAVPAGNWAFQVLPVVDFTATPSQGNAAVAGTYLISVDFAPIAPPVRPPAQMISVSGVNSELAITLALAGVALGAAIGALIRTRNKRPPDP